MSESQPHRTLITWCVKNGGFFHENAEVAHDDQRGYHIRVKPDKRIPATTRIASCPMSCTLSVLNAIDDSPFTCHGSFFPRAFVRKQPTPTIQHFFLMEQYALGPSSWWYPYVSSLPTPTELATADFCDSDAMLWLDGTNLRSAFQKQSDKWRESFRKGMSQLTELGWHSAVEGAYNWNLYKWAAIIFGSRSFTSEVLADTLPADRSRPIGRHHRNTQDERVTKLFADGFGVLLPCLDLLNYHPGSKVEWEASFSYVGLQILEETQPGQELCNNYGPRDNEALLLGYGFALKNNPFDHHAVALRVDPASPVADVRTWAQDSRSDPERRCYIFSPVHPRSLSASCLEFALFSFDLLDTISVLISNDRELQQMYTWKKTLISSGLEYGFADYRNILATVSQLLQECKARHRLILDTAPTSDPCTPKQKYVAIYRQGQLEVLWSAWTMCSYILLRARQSPEDDQVARSAMKTGSSGTSCKQSELTQALTSMPHNARELLHKHDFVTRAGELLSVPNLLDMSPPDLAAEIHQSLLSLRSAILSIEQPSNLDLTKSSYALLLSALSIQTVQGDCLPPRLRHWMAQIVASYPPEDPNWSYVPEDIPGAPETAPPPMLMACLRALRLLNTSEQTTSTQNVVNKPWMSPETYCWGWNVMEEEGVIIPREVAGDEEFGSSEDVAFTIYCARI